MRGQKVEGFPRQCGEQLVAPILITWEHGARPVCRSKTPCGHIALPARAALTFMWFLATLNQPTFRQHALVDTLDGPVALAGRSFQPHPVEDRDRAPAIPDDADALHLAAHLADAGAAHAQHLGEVVLLFLVGAHFRPSPLRLITSELIAQDLDRQ